MKYRLLGKSGLRVSEAALGTMTFGDEWGWGSPRAEAQKVYETYRVREMGQQSGERELFSYAINLEKRVRSDHPLRRRRRSISSLCARRSHSAMGARPTSQ